MSRLSEAKEKLENALDIITELDEDLTLEDMDWDSENALRYAIETALANDGIVPLGVAIAENCPDDLADVVKAAISGEGIKPTDLFSDAEIVDALNNNMVAQFLNKIPAYQVTDRLANLLNQSQWATIVENNKTLEIRDAAKKLLDLIK